MVFKCLFENVRKMIGNETSRRRSPTPFNYTSELHESYITLNEELLDPSRSENKYQITV